jgi:putative FmdB family regulatory protein
MPIYEYLCAKCKGRFEVLVRRESQEIACAGCGSKQVSREFSVFGLNLGAEASAGRSGKGICGCGQDGCAPCSAGL